MDRRRIHCSSNGDKINLLTQHAYTHHLAGWRKNKREIRTKQPLFTSNCTSTDFSHRSQRTLNTIGIVKLQLDLHVFWGVAPIYEWRRAYIDTRGRAFGKRMIKL